MRSWGWLTPALVFLAAVVIQAAALAAPAFPSLNGRVVDQAGILSPTAEQRLNDELATLEKQTGRQLVVVTLSSLQGYGIEDYGYQLGRAWGVGEKGKNTGVLLIVAPSERQVRIEVGYGLEPVLTDALSSLIIQNAILPSFRAGDIEGGIVSGADAIVAQLAMPDDQAKAKVAQAAQAERHDGGGAPVIVIFIAVIVVIIMLRAAFGAGRRGRSRLGSVGQALPWIMIDNLTGSGGDNGAWRSRGGGFSGGGGSFGGGGSSGSW